MKYQVFPPYRVKDATIAATFGYFEYLCNTILHVMFL